MSPGRWANRSQRVLSITAVWGSAPSTTDTLLGFGDRLQKPLVAPDVALHEAVGRPALVDEHAMAANLDVEADRTLHVEREHAVVAVAAEAGRDRQARRDRAVVSAAHVVDLGQLE